MVTMEDWIWLANATPEERADFQARGNLFGEDRDAYMALYATFNSYGLGTLAPKILEYVQEGMSSDTIAILLQKTPEYKQRFAANEVRRKKGLPVLSPAEYLATEQSYRQLMRNAGLPEGFYDQNDDFNNLLAADVSPTELKSRVDLASNAMHSSDPYLRAELKRWGADDGLLTAYFLDPERALPMVDRYMKASQIGAAARRNNLKSDYMSNVELAGLGVGYEQALEGYGTIAGYLGDAEKLASIYGEEYNQKTAEAEVFAQSGEARKKREGLASKERASFGGAVGSARKGLSGSGGAR